MRSALLGLMLASVAGAAVAQDWGNMAVISSTLGNNTNRLCIGDHARPGDIGCPTWAPSLTTAGDVIVSGSVTAAQFIGDGSGLTNVGAASTDRITSGTTSMLAISSTGYISLTQAGTNTGWFDPTRGLITIGVSSTGPISATKVYAGNFGTSGSLIYRDASGNLTASSNLYVSGSTGPVAVGNAVIPNWWGNYSGLVVSGTVNLQGANGVIVMPNNNYIGWNTSTARITGGGGIAGTGDYISMVASGTEAMRIVSSGFVGIGITQPSYSLHVSGTIQATDTLKATYLSASKWFASSGNGIDWGSGDKLQDNSSQHFMNVLIANNEALRIVSTGYVGIGTTTPTAPLEVSGTISATSAVIGSIGTGNLNASGYVSAANFYGNGSGLTNLPAGSVTAGASGSLIYRDATGNLTANSNLLVSSTTNGLSIGGVTQSWLGNDSLYAYGHIRGNGIYANTWLNIMQNGYGITWPSGTEAISGDGTNKYIAFKTSGTEAMRIVSTGYVGIGTTAPSTTLHVLNASGNEQLDLDTLNTGGRVELQLRERGNSVGIVRVRGSTNTDPGLMQIGTTSPSGGIALLYGNASEAMRIVSSGNVGIGTSSPTYKLQVNGGSSGFFGNGNFNLMVANTTTSNTIDLFNGNTGVVASRFFVSSTNSWWTVGVDANDSNKYKFDASSGFTGGAADRVAITRTGNSIMGIGTVTPTATLEVSGTISATHFVGDGSGLTGVASSGDRIVSGSINAIADVSSGAVRVSGTLALNNTGNEPCDAAHYYTFRANPVTQRLEMCRP